MGPVISGFLFGFYRKKKELLTKKKTFSALTKGKCVDCFFPDLSRKWRDCNQPVKLNGFVLFKDHYKKSVLKKTSSKVTEGIDEE